MFQSMTLAVFIAAALAIPARASTVDFFPIVIGDYFDKGTKDAPNGSSKSTSDPDATNNTTGCAASCNK